MPKQINPEQLSEIIDAVKEAVTLSWMGDFVVYGGTAEAPSKQINPLAYQLYLTTLAAVINKMEQIEVLPSAPPSQFDISDN